jgi:hypothetical protein
MNNKRWRTIMSIERLQNATEKILSRREAVRGRGEEATKQAMILPMIEALGYDIWNPAEVHPEYDADVPTRRGGQKEKVDYAITIEGTPRIFIEAKAMDESLDGHYGQLKRYFGTVPSVSLAILTNGIEYRFFTDTGEQNILDDEPFFIARIDALDPGLEVLARFQKEVFSAEAIREYATELTYTAKIVELLRAEIDVRDGELSERFIRWILAADGMYDGRVNANVIERFRPIAKDALQRVLVGIVRRSVAAIDEGVSLPEQTAKDAPEEITEEVLNQAQDEPVAEESSHRKGVVTTEEELEAFAIIKRLFDESSFAQREIFDPSTRQAVPIELGYKDTT